MKDRKIFRIGAADTVNCAQFADAVRGAKSGHTVNTSVAVRGVGGVELVAATDPAHVRASGDGIVDGECEIACNTEDILDPYLVQTGENMFYNSLAHVQCSFRIENGVAALVRLTASDICGAR